MINFEKTDTKTKIEMILIWLEYLAKKLSESSRWNMLRLDVSEYPCWILGGIIKKSPCLIVKLLFSIWWMPNPSVTILIS